MRNNILTFCLLGLICFSLTSCIKKEPLNSEADIEQCSLPEGTLKSDPLITNNTVQLMLLPGSAEITALAPEFTLTPGATIEPASGTTRDFTTPQTYTVTSEDRQWSKVYTVSQNLMISRLSPLQMPIRENMLPNWSLVPLASGVH